MKFQLTIASAAALALAACGGGGDGAQTGAIDNSANMVAGPSDNAVNELAVANNLAPAPMASSGREYVAMAAASDLFEIESSRLAQEKAQNADIKQFAAMLITDHQKSTTDLKNAGARAKPQLVAEPAMNPEQQMNMQALQGASGAEFDRLYISQQVPAHEKALSLVQGYAANGDVDTLKQHAATVAGPIERHLARARELQRGLTQQ